MRAVAMRLVKSALRIAVMVYVGMMIVLAGCQSRMIYYPTRGAEGVMVAYAAESGLSPWRTPEGRLIGWRSGAADRPAEAMLLFHGNAGCAAQRDYLVRGFAPLFDVRVMEYPGYGSREGKTSERSFYAAAEEAFAQLLAETRGPVYLAGESLGGGVASQLASVHPDKVAGLFLITPFTSLADVGRSHYPFLPVGLLLRDRFENDRKLERYRGPVAILLAERDEVVPARLGQELHDGYAGPKRLWVQRGGTHNTLDYRPSAPWWREVADFLRAPDAVPSQSTRPSE